MRMYTYVYGVLALLALFSIPSPALAAHHHPKALVYDYAGKDWSPKDFKIKEDTWPNSAKTFEVTMLASNGSIDLKFIAHMLVAKDTASGKVTILGYGGEKGVHCAWHKTRMGEILVVENHITTGERDVYVLAPPGNGFDEWTVLFQPPQLHIKTGLYLDKHDWEVVEIDPDLGTIVLDCCWTAPPEPVQNRRFTIPLFYGTSRKAEQTPPNTDPRLP